MNINQKKTKTLSLDPLKLQKFEQKSNSPLRVHIPGYKDYSKDEKFIQEKKTFIFKKTFSRFICVQFFYNVRFKILILKREIDFFTDLNLKKILDEIIEIDASEWNIFSSKKIMMNFINSNVLFYIKNFEFLEAELEKYLPKGNLSKNQINDSIFLCALSEFIIFLEKLKIDKGQNLNDLENQINDQKKILINEYIDVLLEFSDDFFIKYMNGVFEILFSELAQNFLNNKNREELQQDSEENIDSKIEDNINQEEENEDEKIDLEEDIEKK